jgi:hypothetical protein
VFIFKMISLALSCQFTVEVDAPRFTVEVIEPPPEQLVIPEEKPRRVYLAMFTASYCGPCQSWKRTVMPQLRAAGYVVREFEMTDPAIYQKYRDRITRYPSFAVIDWETGSWVSGVTVGAISQAAAVRMLGGSVETPATKRVVRHLGRVARPVRYIQWPGWGRIDLETYGGTCTCPMCVEIKAMQRDYWRQLREFEQSQATVSPEQEGTPHDLVEDMLAQVELRSDDIIGDLGCGDGRILIAAAKQGIRGIGIELDPVRAAVARQNVADAGVSDLVTIEVGDALDFDMDRITVATTYLYPPLLAKLAPNLKGLRFVASPFHPVPCLPMFSVGDAWYYESVGEHDEKLVAYNTVGSFRGHSAAVGAGPDASGR